MGTLDKKRAMRQMFSSRLLAFVTAFTFFSNQIIPLSFADINPEDIYQNVQQPTQAVADAPATNQESPAPQPETSQTFLQNNPALRNAEPEQNVQPNESRDLPEYSFDEAIAHFSHDYAAAVIVNSLTTENLKSLLSLDMEIGIAVIHGKIVLFTSGNGEEIRVVPAAKDLLDSAELMAHTHPLDHASMPSLEDINEAGSQIEYVVGSNGIYAYSHDGLINQTGYDYNYLVDQIEKVHDAAASTKETRDILNQFIHDIDEYNLNPDHAELLRSAAVTVFPNQPTLGLFDYATTPANITVNQVVDPTATDPRVRIIHMTYSQTSGSFGGAIINFGNSPADLSALTKFTFDLKTDNSTTNSCAGNRTNCIKVEFVDTNNQVAAVFISNLTSSFVSYDILKSTLNQSNPNVNYASIKQINFTVDYNMVRNRPNGYVDIRTGGLYYQPIAQITTSAVTDFSGLSPAPVVGEFEPCAVNQNPCPNGTGTLNTVVLTQDGPRHFSFDYNLGNGVDGMNDYRRFGGVTATLAQPYDATNGIILGLSGTGMTGGNLKIDFIDPAGKKVTVRIQGLTTSNQNYLISKAILDQAATPGFDVTQITAMIMSVDDGTTGSKTATGTIIVNTRGFSFSPAATITTNDVTNFSANAPVAAELEPCAMNLNPCPDGAGTLNTAVLTQDGPRHFALAYNLGNGIDGPNDYRRFAGASMTLTQPYDATANGIVVGLKGTGTTNGNAKIDVISGNGKKVTIVVSGLTASYQNFLITRALLESAEVSGFDATNIVAMIISVDDVTTGSKTAVGTIEVNSQGLVFSPTATVTTNPVTNFSVRTPSVGELEPCAVNLNPCPNGAGTLNTAVLTQDGPRHFAVAYNLGNGVDGVNDYRRFAGATMTFTLPYNPTNNGIVIGLRGTGTTNGRLKLTVTSITGKTVTVLVNNLTGTYQNFLITRAMLESAEVAGYDATKIISVGVAVDDVTTGSKTATGIIDFNTQGLVFSPTAAQTTNPITDFSYQNPSVGALEPCAVNQNPCPDGAGTLDTITNFTQSSSGQFSYQFNLGNGIEGTNDFRVYGGALINLGTETYDATNGIVLAFQDVSGTSPNLKVDFVNPNGKKVTVRIQGLNTSVQRFLITRALLESAEVVGFDATQISAIAVVDDKSTTGSSTAQGQVVAYMGGLNFVPEVSATPYDQSALTNLTGEPVLATLVGAASGGTANGTITQTQASPSEFSFDYTLADKDDFDVSQMSWGYSNPVNPVITQIPSPFNGYTLRVQDSTMRVQSYDILYKDDIAGPWRAAVYDYAASGTGTTSWTDPGPHPAFRFYTVRTRRVITNEATDFHGHPQNLNPGGIPNPTLTLAVTGPAGKRLTAEVTDVNGKVADFTLLLTGAKQNYSLPLWGVSIPPDFDVTKVVRVNFVSNKNNMGAAGHVAVETKGLKYVQPIDPDTTGAAIVKLPATSTGVRPTLTALVSGKNPDGSIDFSQVPVDYSQMSITQNSITSATMHYDLFNATSYGVSFVDYDDFKTNDRNPATTGDIEVIDLNMKFPNGIVFQLWSPSQDSEADDIHEATLEIKDSSGNVDSFLIRGITSTAQGWKIPLGLLTHVDRTKVQSIALVVNGQHSDETLNINWGDYAYIPPFAPDAMHPDITLVPLTSTGDRPTLTGFVSKLLPDGTTRDYSQVTLEQNSRTSATLMITDLFTKDSYAGAFASFDNPKTDDHNPGTTDDIEFINLNEVFRDGIVLGLSSSTQNMEADDITQVRFEVTDIYGNVSGISGRKDSVLLTGINGSNQTWRIPVSSFDDVDVTKIQSFAIILNGQHMGESLNINWGYFTYSTPISPEATSSAITNVPLAIKHVGPTLTTITHVRPTLTGFASTKNPVDGSTDYSFSHVNQTSLTTATADMGLFTENSYGGFFTNYDDPATDDHDPATTEDIESISLNDAFPDGIVLGLSSPTQNGEADDITEAKLEITDRDGHQTSVLLKNINGSNQTWKILINQFDGVTDVAHVQSIALVVAGQHIGETLNINWGEFATILSAQLDPMNPAITTVPRTSTGIRPAWTGFASKKVPGPNGVIMDDHSFSRVDQTSLMNAAVTTSLFTKDSYGGAFASYDNPRTDDIEYINLNAAFPTGIVLRLSSSTQNMEADDITEAKLDVTDIYGHTDSVLFKNITGSNQTWRISLAQFDEIDLAHVQSFAIVAVGQHIDEILNINWGEFAFIPPVEPDPANPAIVAVPLNSRGLRPVLGVFSSFFEDTDPAEPDNSDDSNVTSTQTSPRLTSIIFDLDKDSSFGGVDVDYDDPATDDGDPATTTDIEGIDLGAAFPNGIVVGMNNGGTVLNEVFLEVKGVDGVTIDSVRLTGITGTTQYWRIPINLFDGVDTTKIRSLAIVAVGHYAGARLNLEWGDFDYIPVIGGVAFDEAQLTPLFNSPMNHPNIAAVGANVKMNEPVALAEINQLSSSEFEFEYDLGSSDSSFAFVTAGNGFFNPDPPKNFIGESRDFVSQYLVIAARGRDGGRMKVEVTDTTHHTASFIVSLRPAYQNFVLDLAGINVQPEFDRHHVALLTFVEDHNLTGNVANDVVKIKTNGMEFIPNTLPGPLQEVKDNLIQTALHYFTVGAGLDPATHLPYDAVEADGSVLTAKKYTQPTSIGFYLQILGDVVRGKTDNGMTVDQALDEINLVMTNLLNIQSNYGWNGLIPWMTLSPTVTPFTNTVALGDNANLSQSIAVMAGALEMTNFTPEQLIKAAAADNRATQYLVNQAAGYAAFVDPGTGRLRASVNRTNGVFTNFYMDRIANEFRGAIAFLKVSYPALPNSIWTGLDVVHGDYTASTGDTIENLGYYDGSAFQAFWPLLRNNERDFVGFRNALYNHLATQADYAAQNMIPGFLSASQRDTANYFGRIGIKEIAETPNDLIGDIGSTYALAAAMIVNPESVLTWLDAIDDQLPAMCPRDVDGHCTGIGFFDAARSNSDIAQRYLGIDVASTILGLTGAGPEEFEVYLRNRGLELSYNLLYDDVSQQLHIDKTTVGIAAPPEFADRSLAVLGSFSSEGTISAFPFIATLPQVARFTYGALPGGFGGHFWNLAQTYNAQANQLVLLYSAQDTPQQIRIELKDAADQILYSTNVTLVNTTDIQKIVINLPNLTKLAAVQKVFVIIDQNATGDTSGNFKIHALDFQHLPSSQNINADASLMAADVTTLPGTPQAQLINSTAGSSLTQPSNRLVDLNYNVSNSGDTAGISINFDPSNNTNGVDLSGLNRIVFGLTSTKNIPRVRMEISDASGNRATLYLTNVDSSQHYYEFLTSLVSSSINLSQVKTINFIVDRNVVGATDQIGRLELDLAGLAFVAPAPLQKQFLRPLGNKFLAAPLVPEE